MGNKDTGRNFAKANRHPHGDSRNIPNRYNSPYRRQGFQEGGYDNFYDSPDDILRGRDFELNAGYRANYDELDSGQWPEVEDAARRRGFDLKAWELEQRGVHRGKGPKSYTRSDMRIREDVNDILLEDRYIDASGIEVSVENGEVILTGIVDDKVIKRRVEDVLEHVSGVKHLENRLRVRNPGGRILDIRNKFEGA